MLVDATRRSRPMAIARASYPAERSPLSVQMPRWLHGRLDRHAVDVCVGDRLVPDIDGPRLDS